MSIGTRVHECCNFQNMAEIESLRKYDGIEVKLVNLQEACLHLLCSLAQSKVEKLRNMRIKPWCSILLLSLDRSHLVHSLVNTTLCLLRSP